MRDEKSGIDRRGFLKTGLQVTAGAAMAIGAKDAHAAIPENKVIPLTGAMPEKVFGKTGHKLPVLAFGGAAMVKQWIGAYGVDLLPDEKRIAMVRYAYDKGLRYFDTARAYGESERLMGKGLEGVRDNVYLSSKVAVSKPEDVRKSVERSLSELNTSYLDCMQIHSPVIEAVGFDGAMAVHKELVKLRDEGMIRFIGLTTHVAFQTVHDMIETGGFDQVLMARGYFRKGMTQLLSNANIEWREQCLAKAHERNMGIVVMKVLGANIMGHNARNLVPGYDAAQYEKLAAAAIRWAIQDQRAHILNIGVSLPSDIDKNIALLKGDLTLTDQDKEMLAEFSGKAYQNVLVKAMKVV